MLNSIVEYYAEHESYKCGYCKRTDTNFSHGMWAHTMTVNDYQDLIDRGWRRSGQYCYKPTMDVTCCPMYTIRCRSQEFKATKSQKKVLKRFNRFLSGEEIDKLDTNNRKMSTSSTTSNLLGGNMEERGDQFVETTREHHQDIKITNIVKAHDDDNEHYSNNVTCDITSNINKTDDVPTPKEEEKQKVVKTGTGLDPAKGPCKKAKQLRKERKLEKLKEKGVDVTSLDNSNKNKEKQLEDFINELPISFRERLEIKLVRTSPPSPEWLATAKETHDVYMKYQMTIHDDKPEKCSESKFSAFLVKSPLLEEYSETGPSCGYGSFHQQYRLDGKIIAVGVLDILPKCVSSVYFFYDPQYMHLTLGTYGALREISFTRYLHSLSPDLKYYYMGYYIHSCQKMRYKGNFYPSDLLCPETYNWFPLKDSISKLEASPYIRLDPNIDNVDVNYPTSNDLLYIPVYVKGAVMPYKVYKRKFAKKNDSTEDLFEYACLVGAKSAKSLILAK